MTTLSRSYSKLASQRPEQSRVDFIMKAHSIFFDGHAHSEFEKGRIIYYPLNERPRLPLDFLWFDGCLWIYGGSDRSVNSPGMQTLIEEFRSSDTQWFVLYGEDGKVVIEGSRNDINYIELSDCAWDEVYD